jgi:hypothetical protein
MLLSGILTNEVSDYEFDPKFLQSDGRTSQKRLSISYPTSFHVHEYSVPSIYIGKPRLQTKQ